MEVEIKPYSGVDAFCIKCGNVGGKVPEYVPEDVASPERLKRTCVCGYSWLEETADKRKKAVEQANMEGSGEIPTVTKVLNALLRTSAFIYANPDLFEELGEAGQAQLRTGLGFDNEWTLAAEYDAEVYICQNNHGDGIIITWSSADLKRFGCYHNNGDALEWRCPDCGATERREVPEVKNQADWTSEAKGAFKGWLETGFGMDFGGSGGKAE